MVVFKKREIAFLYFFHCFAFFQKDWTDSQQYKRGQHRTKGMQVKLSTIFFLSPFYFCSLQNSPNILYCCSYPFFTLPQKQREKRQYFQCVFRTTVILVQKLQLYWFIAHQSWVGALAPSSGIRNKVLLLSSPVLFFSQNPLSQSTTAPGLDGSHQSHSASYCILLPILAKEMFLEEP